jgi:hypothetical protein
LLTFADFDALEALIDTHDLGLCARCQAGESVGLVRRGRSRFFAIDGTVFFHIATRRLTTLDG